MAIYNGREVQIERIQDTNPISGSAVVSHKNGTVERVSLSNLQLTADEKKQIEKDHNLNLDTANTISDKDVKQIRDSQDPDKVEKKKENKN